MKRVDRIGIKLKFVQHKFSIFDILNIRSGSQSFHTIADAAESITHGLGYLVPRRDSDDFRDDAPRMKGGDR